MKTLSWFPGVPGRSRQPSPGLCSTAAHVSGQAPAAAPAADPGAALPTKQGDPTRRARTTALTFPAPGKSVARIITLAARILE